MISINILVPREVSLLMEQAKFMNCDQPINWSISASNDIIILSNKSETDPLENEKFKLYWGDYSIAYLLYFHWDNGKNTMTEKYSVGEDDSLDCERFWHDR